MISNSDIEKRMVEYRRHLHQNPELSFQEEKTATFIKQVLVEEGIRVEDFGTHHNFAAIMEGSSAGKTYGLRAELDALPITERSGVDFSSVNPTAMHACGHDMHMAIAMGVTLSLHRQRENLKGRFVAIFESGEEVLPGGAQAITQSKLFSLLKPDAMFGVHVLPELEVGKIGVCPGKYMASGDEVYITIDGKGGHAALPHLLIDPVVCAAEIILGLQTIVSRKAPALIPTVLSFGRVEALGATNIIPDEVSIAGTFRTMDEAWRNEAHRLIQQTATGIAASHGAKCEIEIRKGYPSIHNNPELTQLVKKIAKELIGNNNVIDLDPRTTTDDFSYFSNLIPSVFFRVGTGFPNIDNAQLHRPNFNPAEEAIGVAHSLLTKILLTLMT
ncbi:MAG TPA: amidohydrolase [Bacteroidales bacterium]|nr:amidohydrolase [Bacteroidales bacterium]